MKSAVEGSELDLQEGNGRAIAYCCLALIVALYVVGYVSHGILRHLVQTAPVWVIFALGMKRSELAKWAAIPCFMLWLFLMSLIWLFLAGVSNLISGTFSPIEITMTIVVGSASIAGMVLAVSYRTRVRPLVATAVFVGLLALQVVALKISFLPRVSHD